MTVLTAGEALTGRTALLRSVTQRDYGPLHHYASAPSAALTWRFRGRSVSPEAFPSLLWQDCLCQFVIAPYNKPWECAGLISIFNHDAVSGTAYLSVLLSDEFAGASSFAGESVLLAVGYAQRAFGLRKLYIETTDSAVPGGDRIVQQFSSVREEGRLLGHVRMHSRWWDVKIIALYVDDFLEEAARLNAFAAPDVGHRSASRPSFDEVRDLVCQILGAPVAAASGGALLCEDLGADSLGLLECFVALDERWGLRATEEEVARARSLQELYSLIEASAR
jgi:acyl carrier protein/RimJ/RimL family protein N-acetyltransferase